jgi:hypothetical protein
MANRKNEVKTLGAITVPIGCDFESVASGQIVSMPNDTELRAQKFFADIAAEMRKPHFGERGRELMAAILVRAEEAKLYTPERE